MLETILQRDTELFLWLNSFHNKVLDVFMYEYTQILVWVPFYLFLLGIVIYRKRKKAIVPILLLIAAVTCTDQTCNLLKRETGRLRPSHTEALANEIHLIKESDGNYYRGGKYTFPSGHSANSMMCAFFVIYFIANKRKWIIYSILAWALLMGYTRIYVGVHYPIDVFCGFLLGAFFGTFFFKLGSKICR